VDEAAGAALNLVVRADRVVLIVGLGAAVAGQERPYRVSAANSAAGGITLSLIGVLFAQLVLGMLGVLAFSGEYPPPGYPGHAGSSCASRLPVLWAS